MPLTMLAAIAETTTQSNNLWMLAASIPMVLLAAQKTNKKKRLGFLKRWLLKIAIKKANRRENKNTGAKIIVGLLLAFGLTALLSLLVGWLWAAVIVLVGVTLELVFKKK